jgi:excisionase family DNA binding protein
MEQRKIFNVKELCQYLKISESCIRKAIRENKIPFFRIMSRVLFDKEAVDKYISDNSIKNMQPVQEQLHIRCIK